MRTLNELLEINMSYDDILNSLSEQTDSFTLPEGEVAFDDQYEAEVAVSILKNHYNDVDNSGIGLINEAAESAFVIKFSDPKIDELDFPNVEDEERQFESLAEDFRILGQDLRKRLTNVTGFDDYNDKISITRPDKREYRSKYDDTYYFTVNTLYSSLNFAKEKLISAVNSIISYMKKLGYKLEYEGDMKTWNIARNTKLYTRDYQRQNTRVSKQLVFYKPEENKPKRTIPKSYKYTDYGVKADNGMEFVDDTELYDYFGESLLRKAALRNVKDGRI